MPFFTPTRGGSVTVPYDLIKALGERGHQITLVTTDFEFDEEYARSLEGVEVLAFPCVANLSLFLYSPAMAKWLKENLASFDIVHLHEFRTYQNTAVLRYSKKWNVPFVVQAHGSAAIIAGKGILKRAYDLVWGKRIIKRAGACLAVSELEVPDYLGLGADRANIKVIPNGLRPENFRLSAQRGSFRKDLGLGHDDVLILFFGRLNRIKGVDVLIKAFARLWQVRKNAYLVIAGPDDGQEQELTDLARSSGCGGSIRFVGPIPSSKRASAYADADVVAYPSRYEIFGMVPFEAIMCGTPVVVSSDCGCGQMIIKASCGLAVPLEDDEALASAIGDILDDSQMAKEMVTRGQKYIVENLRGDLVAKMVDGAYREALDKRRYNLKLGKG
ncbi:glycosyltransferase family 4 protein [Methanomassiliicoccus luminyensis]|uniref:glycosyltransferase family 4 protein n=1 Tax=Methanomassiliicoccus luminyensis TaxID=1080712 RepID=UPI001F2F223D|nr:glycosyltransferase family 4 protein [Methanomassiliicoccus luminyensis]